MLARKGMLQTVNLQRSIRTVRLIGTMRDPESTAALARESYYAEKTHDSLYQAPWAHFSPNCCLCWLGWPFFVINSDKQVSHSQQYKNSMTTDRALHTWKSQCVGVTSSTLFCRWTWLLDTRWLGFQADWIMLCWQTVGECIRRPCRFLGTCLEECLWPRVSSWCVTSAP